MQRHLQDLGAPSSVWQRHVDDAVKAAWPDQRGINGARPVGGAQHHEASVVLKAVHLLSVCVWWEWWWQRAETRISCM